ncbi:Rossmann-like and DUF2520 domain-containing protein [Fluviicola taffensis]|uniref:DUF2520 domain-containing protein n=1 Tax=Fluviicola taffensis (strain DSM 16823 / NCIMB 13979 / RW262) TaxID=755732 RepID=F2IIH4_FLUTR|nr:Rossmann-like and DUF2520 domain-containing protein [Fluviicola taffensis]AEA44900.1 Domain of unknown function DUF2520-containing protein [Fluviicola taffensis DSM 16823]
MNQKLKIGIVGMGNVGIHFLQRLIELGHTHLTVYSRSGNNLPDSIHATDVQFTNDFKEFIDFDLVFCAVNDNTMLDMIQLVSKYAPVVSVSGTVNLNHLTTKYPIGTFYPLQSFISNQPVHWEGLPIFIESQDLKFNAFLVEFAQAFSGNGIQLSEDKRQHLHVAAVFANNFTNHLIDLAAHFCQEHEIEFDWLKPLINQTIEKIQTNNPHDILTGPAVRNDQSTIQKHLQLLNSDQKNIYQTLTASIIKHHK